MTHTPGPWTIEGTRDSDEFWVVKDEGPVCEISQTFGYPDADEANARLIAAAPELLAIVQHLADAQRDGAQGVHFGALFGDDDVTTLGDAVTAAIAKAEEVGA